MNCTLFTVNTCVVRSKEKEKNMKISIITITFNSEKTLEETIKSVVNQDYPELEYIIIDGKSTDNTISIIKEYEDKISYWVSEKDKGICDAFNKGIAAATGDVIGIINSDDILLPGALQAVEKAYKSDVDVYYGDGIRIFEDGSTKPYKAKHHKKLKTEMALVHPATFVSKQAYRKYGVFDPCYRTCMDRELLLRMLIAGAVFKKVDCTLAGYRMGGVSDQNSEIVNREREEISYKYGVNKYEVYLHSKVSEFKKQLSDRIRTRKHI